MRLAQSWCRACPHAGIRNGTVYDFERGTMKQDRGKSNATWRVDAAGLLACAVLTFAAWLAGAEPLMRRHDQNVQHATQLAQERQKQQELLASNRDLKARLAAVEQALDKAQVTLQPA